MMDCTDLKNFKPGAATKGKVMELPNEMAPGPQHFFLANFSHGHCDGCVMWYRPNACGYTPDLKQAGAYTAEEAKRHEGPDTVAVPVEWLHQYARLRMVVDAGDTHPVGGAFWSAQSLRDVLPPNAKLDAAPATEKE